MKAGRLTHMALLTAVALMIFIIEAQIPAPIPVPGVKLGLANIITVYAMFVLGPRDTLLILLTRIFLGSIFAGQLMSFMYSFTGGMVCFGAMWCMRRLLTLDQLWICSVIGALAHNMGQIAIAIWVTKTPALISYLPILIVSGMVTGTFTGFCAQFLVNRLKRLHML